jgi:hypothetical protein
MCLSLKREWLILLMGDGGRQNTEDDTRSNREQKKAPVWFSHLRGHNSVEPRKYIKSAHKRQRGVLSESGHPRREIGTLEG